LLEAALADSRDSEVSCIDVSILDGIRALQNEGEPDILTELINMYLRDSKAHMERVSLAFSHKDAALLRRSLHSLKGISGNMGATRFSNYCYELNGQLDQHATFEGLEGWLPKLQQEYEQVYEALSAERNV
jgi:HPt (histidine-containing phosphotransfer) domain-containing protein